MTTGPGAEAPGLFYFMPNHDFSVEDHGSIFLVTPHTDAAKEWWETSVDDGQSFGPGYAVEHRFIQNISHAILDAGMTITKDGKTMQVSESTGDLVLV